MSSPELCLENEQQEPIENEKQNDQQMDATSEQDNQSSEEVGLRLN